MNNKKYLSHGEYLADIKRGKRITLAWQIGLLIGFLLLWEFGALAGLFDSFMTSSPSRILRTLGRLGQTFDFYFDMGLTLLECLIGFVLSTVIGSLTAVGLWSYEPARKVLEPYIVVLNSLPKIALGPLIILWVGVGMPAIITMCVLISVIITVISMLNSFIQCDPDKILLLRSMGANKYKILTKLVLPQAVPAFLSVLKINVGLSWVGTIMGEFLVSEAGLGNKIIYGGLVFNNDLVMTCTVVLCVLAALMYLVVAIIEKAVLKRRR